MSYMKVLYHHCVCGLCLLFFGTIIAFFKMFCAAGKVCVIPTLIGFFICGTFSFQKTKKNERKGRTMYISGS